MRYSLFCIKVAVCIVALSIIGNIQLQAQTYELPSRIVRDTIQPTIALVLSGGGARAFAHVGVLKALEEQGIKPNYIVGTSMGAIVGGLYACGYSASELEEIITQTKWDEIFFASDRFRDNEFLDMKVSNDRSLLTLYFDKFRLLSPDGISEGQRVSDLLTKLVWQAPVHPNNFDSALIPFRAVATDLVAGESIALKQGDIVEAMRASATYPLRFKPVKINGRILVDGGILANVPVSIAHREFAPDIIIAVDATSELSPPEDLNAPWAVADQVVTVMMRTLDKQQIAPADVIITPELDSITTSSFTKPHLAIAAGYTAASLSVNMLATAISAKRAEKITEFLLRNDPLPTAQTSVSAPLSKMLGVVALLNNAFQTQGVKEILIDSNHLQPSLQPVYLPQCKRVMFLTPDFSTPIQVFEHHYTTTEHSLEKWQIKLTKILRARGDAFSKARFVEMRGDTAVFDIDNVYIKNIRVQGNSSVSSSLIAKESGLIVGEKFMIEKAIAGRQKLLGLSSFTDVSYIINYVNPHEIDVQIRVQDNGDQSVKIGFRTDNEQKGQLGIDIVQENLFSLDIRMMLRAAGSFERSRYAKLMLEAPMLFESYWGGGGEVYVQRESLFLYRQQTNRPANSFERSKEGENIIERYGVKGHISRRLDRDGILLGEFRYEQQRAFNAELPEEAAGFSKIGTVRFATSFDNRVRTDFPRHGRRYNLGLETSVLPGISVGFSKVTFDYQTWLSSGEHTLIPQFHVGFADKTTPYAEQFSLGGENIFYGMREDEERGAQLFRAGLEYRLHLPFSLIFDSYFSVRYDIGSTWSSPTAVRIAELRHGIGLALGLDTPIGPAMLSLGRSFYFTKQPDAVFSGPWLGYFSVGVPIR